MYIYTLLCTYWIALYMYVLVFIVPHVDIELEDNKQFISNIPRKRKPHINSTVQIYFWEQKAIIVPLMSSKCKTQWYYRQPSLYRHSIQRQNSL